eukprot:5768089-Amphidinium_carterae.1
MYTPKPRYLMQSAVGKQTILSSEVNTAVSPSLQHSNHTTEIASPQGARANVKGQVPKAERRDETLQTFFDKNNEQMTTNDNK